MPNFALINCNMIDCVNPGIRSEMTVLVKNGKIEEIGKTDELTVPSGYRVIELKGKYVMPGLINAHVHLLASGKPMKAFAGGPQQDRLVKLINTKIGHKVVDSMVKSHAAAALNSGVTTMRCVGDINYSDVKIRDLISKGMAQGPRLLVSGPVITPTGGHGQVFAYIADSPWEVRKYVRKNIFEQVDLIKICSTGGVADCRRLGDAGRPEMTVEEITAACEEAHKAGFMVASHVESTEGVRQALLGGVDTIEHGAALDDELIKMFLDNPRTLRGYSCLIPTIFPAMVIAELDPSITYMKPVHIANSRVVYEGMVVGMKQAMEAGIRVGLGTDASCSFVTHYNTWRELEYVVKMTGITPERAILNATRSNAEIIGIDDITGTLEKGKSADLIVLEKNPLEDLRTLSKVLMVMAGETFIEKPEVKIFPEVETALDGMKF